MDIRRNKNNAKHRNITISDAGKQNYITLNRNMHKWEVINEDIVMVLEDNDKNGTNHKLTGCNEHLSDESYSDKYMEYRHVEELEEWCARDEDPIGESPTRNNDVYYANPQSNSETTIKPMKSPRTKECHNRKIRKYSRRQQTKVSVPASRHQSRETNGIENPALWMKRLNPWQRISRCGTTERSLE